MATMSDVAKVLELVEQAIHAGAVTDWRHPAEAADMARTEADRLGMAMAGDLPGAAGFRGWLHVRGVLRRAEPGDFVFGVLVEG